MDSSIKDAVVSTERQSVAVTESFSTTMECFRKLLSAMGLTLAPTKKVDVISNLPVEISQLILRMLDTSSLLNATSVSRSWLKVCTGDFQLRQSARRLLRKQRRQLQNTGIALKCKKPRHSNDYKMTQLDLQNCRTYNNPLSHKFIDAPSACQTMRTTRFIHKNSSTSNKNGMTAKIRSFR